MTGETMRALLEPLIGKSGVISMLVSRIGPVAFPVAENKKLTGVGFARTAWSNLSARPGGP